MQKTIKEKYSETSEYIGKTHTKHNANNSKLAKPINLQNVQ